MTPVIKEPTDEVLPGTPDSVADVSREVGREGPDVRVEETGGPGK